MTQFAFLKPEFASVYELARKAETSALSDPRGSCFYARLALETAVNWLYDNDNSLRSPYDNSLSALIHEGTFRTLVGNVLVAKARIIKDFGNRAVHDTRAVAPQTSVTCVRELFHFSYWLVRTYARGAKPDAALAFSVDALPRAVQVEASSLAKLQEIAKKHEDAERQLAEARDAKLRSDHERLVLDEEVKRLQAEIAAIKQANQATPDNHDYSEAETRDAFIDLLLAEAGWSLDQKRDREYPVKGMPNQAEEGFVDYVLWGDDGKPLAVIEAKRTKRDPRVGQQQAKLYADCLEKEFGVRPTIFYTHGYEHWLWDDVNAPPRQVHGFLKKDELTLLHQRRQTKRKLADIPIDAKVVERYYQTRAVKRVGEVFEKEGQRKALLVMATGSGKTRTVIALIDQLMRANWVKRVLFLADRVALVKQAHNNFKQHLPTTPSANLIERHDPKKNDHNGARICVATYPTMMGLINELQNGQRLYGSGHFDLIVIDEAHRSIYRKYRSIFDYFDSYLVGLTATPRDEIDRDTYSLFELEKGVPTDAYDLDEAVSDGFLVPPTAISVPLKFQREGIKYDDLSDEEKEQWDMMEWEEGKLPPDQIDASAINKWLFNADTVDKVLEHLMTHGLKVNEGDRLGKTIVFAKNHDHAMFIAKRFDENYPHLKGEFARVIDFKTEYAQSLIDDFSVLDKAPHIAISVDMLDTGIDVPEVVNLVFFKIVRSKTKFWQMIGRGTRLCPNLYGPNRHKDQFLIFDFCQNFEFFNQNPNAKDGAVAVSLSQKLFAGRVELSGIIDGIPALERSEGLETLLGDTKAMLFDEVSGMSLENFLVRAKRRAVEQFQVRDAWDNLTAEDRLVLINDVAGLPSAVGDSDISAKQFDYLILKGQLDLLETSASFATCKEKCITIAACLETLGNVPMVAAEMALILEIQTEEYWTDINPWMLETLRRRLRNLINLIEGDAKQIVYTDFTDEIGDGTTVALPDAGVGTDKARFQLKVRHFLQSHADHITIRKLRRNEQLTPLDLAELERIMLEEAVATNDDLTALNDQGGLGLFIRSLVGLERDAAKGAFAEFLQGRNPSVNQMEFINIIIDHLTENGAMEPKRLYESPFTDLDDQGVGGLFPQADVLQIVSVLNDVKLRAAA